MKEERCLAHPPDTETLKGSKAGRLLMAYVGRTGHDSGQQRRSKSAAKPRRDQTLKRGEIPFGSGPFFCEKLHDTLLFLPSTVVHRCSSSVLQYMSVEQD